MENQAPRADRERATADAQSTQQSGQQYSGGSAMLDAQVQSSSQAASQDNDAVANTGAQSTEDTAKNADKQTETTGIYAADLKELDDEGDLSLKSDSASE